MPRLPAPVQLAAGLLVAGLLVALGAGCATPVPPTGGPADTTPPRLLASVPAADSVNVRTDRLWLEFSKAVDATSLRRALSIAPDFPSAPTVTVRGRRAEVAFPDSLRANTTYVVTIGTDLRDLRNNRLAAPITLAFATGPTIDRGRIAGTVRSPASGRPVDGMDLFAYALPEAAAALPDSDVVPLLPDPRTTPPDYRTQTDQEGRFTLDYLRDAPYYVVAVEDRNRNRRADPGEAFAVPRRPAARAVAPEDTAAAPPLALYVARVDTLPPELLRVRPRSRSRLAVRFTEPVLLRDRDPAAFALADSASGRPVPVEVVYADDDPFQVILRTAPMEPGLHRLRLVRPEAVADTAGNVALPGALTFTPVATPDTLRPRVVAFEPVGPDSPRALRPGQVPVVVFSEPPERPEERITVADAAGAPAPFTLDGVGRRVGVRAETTGPFSVRVRLPDSTYVQAYTALPADSLGTLSGRVEGAPPGVPVVVEAWPAGAEMVRVTAAPDGAFALPPLPAGEVRLRAFADRDGSGQWDGGRLAPYRPPEPLALPPPARVRPRWDTELDPVRLDSEPAPAATPPPPPTEVPPDE